jgi:2-keto-myo-inositol isomerase
MLDAHRLFVGPADRLDSVGQVRQLLDTGYQEYISFEPFADDLWHQSDPAAVIKSCMDFVREQLMI